MTAWSAWKLSTMTSCALWRRNRALSSCVCALFSHAIVSFVACVALFSSRTSGPAPFFRVGSIENFERQLEDAQVRCRLGVVQPPSSLYQMHVCTCVFAAGVGHLAGALHSRSLHERNGLCLHRGAYLADSPHYWSPVLLFWSIGPRRCWRRHVQCVQDWQSQSVDPERHCK